MADIIGIGLGAAAGAGSSALGGIGRRRREERQVGYQHDMMAAQYAQQRKLNEQGQELGMKTWNETNYGAQMGHMKEAGLNPALMYGMSGGGGTTGGSPSGGSGASGSAPQVKETQTGTGALMGMQTMAQIKLLQEQARKTGIEADKTAGVDTEETRTKGNLNLQNAETMASLTGKYTEEADKLSLDNQLTRATWNSKMEIINKEALRKGLELEAMGEGITLTKEKITETINKVYQEWAKVGLKGLDTALQGVLGKGGIGAIKRLMTTFKGKK